MLKIIVAHPMLVIPCYGYWNANPVLHEILPDAPGIIRTLPRRGVSFPLRAILRFHLAVIRES